MISSKQVQFAFENEDEEILDLLPRFDGLRVLMLGRFTDYFSRHIAKRASSVRIINLMETKEDRSDKEKSKSSLADVSKLDAPKNSFDLIIANQLLMLMSDEQVQTFFLRCLCWLKTDGYLFFRETCTHSKESGASNVMSEKWRSPTEYTAALYVSVLQSENEQQKSGYEILLSKPLDSVIKNKFNYREICWLAKKIDSSETSISSYKTFQEFLDQQQYSINSILQYEHIFGKHFVSPGGPDTTEQFVKLLNLKPRQKLLDVGSGIGGSAFYMAKNYDMDVIGIDLSYNMVSISWQRNEEMKNQGVTFVVADAMKVNLPSESFDVVYSRDTILHIPDKRTLFSRFLDWLKPGGKLLISDYCCSDQGHSEQFRRYVMSRGYMLLSPLQYGKVLEEAGFSNVKVEDKTHLFIQTLDTELQRLQSSKSEFLLKFKEADYEGIENGWKDKLTRCKQGEQRWGLFYAEKPLKV